MNKRWSIVLRATAASVYLATAARSASGEVPKGWGFHNPSGDYDVILDKSGGQDGKPGISIRPRTEKSFEPSKGMFGILYQTISAEKYRGKRVRYSAYAKGENINYIANFWLRSDREDGSPDWYDSQNGRPLSLGRVGMKDTFDWDKVEFVTQIQKSAASITFGLSLYGNGRIWLNGIKLEVVSKEVPITAAPKLPSEPVNMF